MCAASVLAVTGRAMDSASSGVAIPDWPVGTVAPADVVTPVELYVRNEEATAHFRTLAIGRVSAIYRYEPGAGAAAAAELERNFAAARERWLAVSTPQFGPPPLADAVVDGDAWRQAFAAWAGEWPGYPVERAQAAAWSRGEVGQAALRPLLEALRRGLVDRRIVADATDPDRGMGPADVRLVRIGRPGEILTLAAAQATAEAVRRSALEPLETVRNELRAALAPHASPAAVEFALTLVRPNVAYDPVLTREDRQKHAEAHVSLDRYRPGDFVVRRGETVTPAIAAALEQMRLVVPPDLMARMPTVPAASAPPAPGPAHAPVPSVGAGGHSVPWSHWWLPTAAVLALALAILVLARRVQQTHRSVQHSTALTVLSTAPGSAAGAVHSGGSGPSFPAGERERIVARALRDSAVQALYTERQALAAQNREATDRLAGLEQRVARLQPLIQARLQAYEKRIAELEAALRDVRDEARQPLHDQLVATRQERDEYLAGLK